MSRGGARPGAGRKKTDRQPAKFYVTAIEKEYLKSCLIAFRRAEERKHEKFEEHMEKIGQQTLPLSSQERAEASKASNRYNYRKRNKKRSEAKYGAVSGKPKEHLAAYCTAARVVVQ